MHYRARNPLIGALSLLCLLLLRSAAVFGQDVIPAEEAYPYSLEAGPEQLTVRFDIRDGYYLYRKRFSFSTDTPGVSLGPARFPKGEIHSDEFFGEMEIYRGSFDITVPYTREGRADAVDLELGLQGCADIGLCYPPQHWTRRVTLPPAAAPSTQGLSALIPDAAQSDILPPDQAFTMSPRIDGANQLTIGWQIAPGYYLYRDKLAFRADSGGIELGAARLPSGQSHHDENFGDVQVFYDYVEAVVPFSRASPEAMPFAVDVTFQGCKENSVCYPPMEQKVSLTLPAASEFAAVSSAPLNPPLSEQDRLATLVLNSSWWIVGATFYGLGLLLAFTPCVLPMVPILSGIIVGQGEKASARRGFALSASYVMGMAATYTVAGALAALAGQQIQAIFQKTWIIVLFAGLFAVLGVAMLGAFQLQMPAAIQTRLARAANRQKAGTFIGTAIMGALSALIVTTCVAPPLVAALAVIGQSGDVGRGSGALFALSLGMGSPLLVVGASAGQLLPKIGPWMNAVKAAFGVMMLGVAVWMLGRVLPGTVTLLLWALLVFLTGVFLGALDPLPVAASPRRRLSKGIGLLVCLYGALMLIGSVLGGDDPMSPIPRGLLANRAATEAAAEPALAFQPVESVAELEVALTRARAQGAPVMVDFTADWCVSCKEMERYTFPDSGVKAALKPFVLLRADVSANDEGDKALLKYFDSYGPPTIAFFDSKGRRQKAYKLVGFVPAKEFAAHVTKLAAL